MDKKLEEALKTDLVKELGLENLPEKDQREILLSFSKIVFQAIMLRLLDEMPDETKEELGKLLEEKPEDDEALYNFLKEKVPNFDRICAEEIAKLKAESLEYLKL